MITISTCMIVKNEEAVLERCLKCVKPFSDEIIIVDTGSTDRTKEIAAKYTDKIYDFEWIDDFSAARNYAHSLATMEYIYSADADEIIDQENINLILQLKEVLLPEIEMVQMYYDNQLEMGTTYNYDKEYRPKMVKRQREFVWQDPLHESFRTEPIIYDSDVVIIHKPTSNHANRDFAHLQEMITAGHTLSSKLNVMYAKELFICGTNDDFLAATDYFLSLLNASVSGRELSDDELTAAQCVLVKCGAIFQNPHMILGAALKNMANGNGSSEVCTCLGEYYEKANEYQEAAMWYYNAAYEAEPHLAIRYGNALPLEGLIRCYDLLGLEDMKTFYTEELKNR